MDKKEKIYRAKQELQKARKRDAERARRGYWFTQKEKEHGERCLKEAQAKIAERERDADRALQDWAHDEAPFFLRRGSGGIAMTMGINMPCRECSNNPMAPLSVDDKFRFANGSPCKGCSGPNWTKWVSARKEIGEPVGYH